jgi:Mechanosensitive ion channel, beta-domain
MSDRFAGALGHLGQFLVHLAWIAGVIIALLWLSGKFRKYLENSLTKQDTDSSVIILIDNLVRFSTYLLVALLALGELTGGTGSTITAVGLVAAAVSLSLQDVLRNFVSGIYLLIERPFSKGDVIRVLDQKGSVDRIDIRTTVLRNANDEEVFVPNFKVFSEVVRKEPQSYSTHFNIKSPGPVHETFEAIWKAALSVQVDPSLPPSVKITGADETDVDFDATIWQPTGTDQSEAFIAAVKTSLEDAVIKKRTD